MNDVLTIRGAVNRAKEDNLQVSEYALRQMVKSGKLPVRLIGRKALVYYPALVRHLQCIDGGDVHIKNTDTMNGVRKVE